MTDIHDDGVLELPMTDQGRQIVVKIRRATARIGMHAIHWIQPLGGTNALTAFLASHGEGIHHVAFDLPTPARFDLELRTLAAAGVGVAQEGTFNTPAGPARFAYLDTATAGGIAVELLYNPATVNSPASGRVDQRGSIQSHHPVRVRRSRHQGGQRLLGPCRAWRVHVQPERLARSRLSRSTRPIRDAAWL